MGNYLSSYGIRIGAQSKAAAAVEPQVKSIQNMTFGMTKVQNEYSEYYWIVKNFSQLEQYSVKSPEFTVGKDINQKWALELIPKCMGDRGENWTEIRLHVIDPGEKKFTTHFKIIASFNGFTVEKTMSHEFRDDYTEYGWYHILKCPKNIKNDRIVIVCQILLKNIISQTQTIDGDFLNSLSPQVGNFEKFRAEFGKILDNPGEEWDLRILVDERDFKAHKAILSARSPVFSRMLSTRMKEAQSSTISIDDFDPEIVESMLMFIYTGKTAIGQNALELFKISDKYDLPDLKAECEVELVKNLNFENALGFFDIGDKFNAPLLKSLSIEFIIRNDEEILKLPEFKENLKNNSQLSFELLRAVLLDKKGQNPKINFKPASPFG